VSRIFLSHSSLDMRQAVALKTWLAEQNPPLANEIFLDVDPESGLRAGTRWKDALRRANARCEAVICLLSANWEASHECKVEYRTAENLNKQIFVARLESSTGDELTSEWQRCDLFGDGPKTPIDIGDGPPVEFATEGLYRLRDGILGAGIGADSFVWPPPSHPDRAPYRGWEPLDSTDAAVFFGRDTQILRALDAVRGMRLAGVNSLFVVLGPSGTGKSSFLRAGLLPRLRREDRRFALLDIVRPERNAVTGESGLAAAICNSRKVFGLQQPSLGEVKALCDARDVGAVAALLTEVRATAAERLLERGDGAGDVTSAPTLVLPLDQAEELFSADAGDAADAFLTLLAGVTELLNDGEIGLIVTATIRTDRFEVMQTHPQLAGIGAVLFDELKPMPPTQFKEVIVGPAERSTDAGRSLRIAPDLVDRLLLDAGQGADTLPMLALTLSRLYTDYGATGELELSHYESLGGMRRVVQTEIDEVLSSDPAQRIAQLNSLRAAFIPWLATINPDNDQPMRRVARWSDLPPESRTLIDALIGKRLMVKDTRGGQTVVEVALESLLRQWDELAGWLRDERKDLKDADDLERSTAAWLANSRSPEWLLAGTRLAEATALADKPGFGRRLADSHDFLNASHQVEAQRRAAEEEQRQAELLAAQERAEYAQERARLAEEQQVTAEAHTVTLRKRSRVLRAVLAVTAVVAVVAAFGLVRANASGNEAKRQLRDATGQRLLAEAQSILSGTRPGTDAEALQLVLAAQSLVNTPPTDAVFNAAVRKSTTEKIIIVPGARSVVSDVSPDGRWIVTGDDAHNVRIWDAETGEPVGEALEGHSGAVTDVAFSPDGSLVASGSDDKTVRIWDTQNWEARGEPLQGHVETVTDVVFSPDGRTLASGSSDDTVRLWDVLRGRVIAEPLPADNRSVSAATFDPDGKTLVTGGYSGFLRFWDPVSGRQLGEPVPGDEVEVSTMTALAHSPDGRYLAVGRLGGEIDFWDAEARTRLGSVVRSGGGIVPPYDVAFSPDGRRLVSGDGDEVVRLWDVETGDLVSAFSGHTEALTSVAFTPDARRIVSTARDGTVRIWNTTYTLWAEGKGVHGVTFDPQKRTLAASNNGGGLWEWDIDSGEFAAALLDGVEHTFTTMAFSRDGDRIATGNEDGMVQLWNAEDLSPVGQSFPGAGGRVRAIRYGADDETVVTVGSDGAMRSWDASTGRPIGGPRHLADEAFFSDAAISPDGRLVAVSKNDQSTTLFDAVSGDQVGEPFTGEGRGTMTMAFSPDGTRLAIAGTENSIQLWNTADQTPVGERLTGHGALVTSVSFNGDGTRLLSSSLDGTVRLWDGETGRPIGEPIAGHGDGASRAEFSSDGRTIASVSFADAVRLWPASAGPEDLCAKLTANMSEKQWDDWVSPDIDYVKSCPDLPVAPD
jgi:WD40 repeat protein